MDWARQELLHGSPDRLDPAIQAAPAWLFFAAAVILVLLGAWVLETVSRAAITQKVRGRRTLWLPDRAAPSLRGRRARLMAAIGPAVVCGALGLGAQQAIDSVNDAYEALIGVEEALALEPHDFETAIELARLRRQAGDTDGAMAAAEAARAAATTDSERSVAGNDLGDMLVAAGDLAGARSHYEQSLAIRERLAVADPSSAAAQRDLSVGLNRLGDVLVAAGDLAGALTRYAQSLAIHERLAATEPRSAAAQRDVSVSVQALQPFLRPGSRPTELTQVVRTDLGELKWLHADATDDTDLERLGQRIYIVQGCWNCHSQTRRIGPDLTRVGLKYSDEWHLAHFWDPRMVVPDSIMPRFVGLFDAPPGRVAIVEDAAGNRTLERNAVTAAIFDFDQEDVVAQHRLLTPNADGLVFVRERGTYPVIFTPNDEYAGDTVELAVMTPELEGLIAYLQKLGMNRGKWRDVFEPQLLEASEFGLPRSEEWIAHGQAVYERRCAGCHGVTGDGNGPAATFMDRFRPRNFQLAVFKFRLVDGPLPTDGDLMRTLTRGVRGSAMPTWHSLPIEDRLAVIQYIKFQLAVDRSDPDDPYLYFVEEPPGQPLFIGTPPPPTPALIGRGKEVWRQAKCWECHGDTGRGDGDKAAGLKDDFGYPIRPADLTTGQFKSGPMVQDMFRTMTTGLAGTPMPSFGDSLPAEDRWALAYYVLALSAFKDPLTGAPLPIAAADRQALNDPATAARTSDTAYAPPDDPAYAAQAAAGETVYGGAAWAKRHGLELLPAAGSAAGVSR